MRSWWTGGTVFLAALLFSPAVWGSVPPQPGTVNYVEGQAAIGSQALTESSVGNAKLAAGQSLSTTNGRAEILLTPGVFLRLDNQSSVRMDTSGLADTSLTIERGRAMVEVASIRPENNIRIGEDGWSTQLLKAGLYDFDADHGVTRVFDGKAVSETDGRQIQLKGGHQLNLQASEKLKAQKFDKKQNADDFYRWSSLRASYLAEANVDAARRYAGGSGWMPGGWYGYGWYWSPWFDAYTFIPGDGIFYDPFGWGFYSPFAAFGAPYFGVGYFGYPYGGGRFYRHFGPGYHPPVLAAGGRTPVAVGHARSVPGGSVGAPGRGGFGGGGFRGGAVVRGGGGFRGGGSGGFHAGGGGFHGGGGGGGMRGGGMRGR